MLQRLQQARGLVAAMGDDRLGQVAFRNLAGGTRRLLQRNRDRAGEQVGQHNAQQQRDDGTDDQNHPALGRLLVGLVARLIVQTRLALFHAGDGGNVGLGLGFQIAFDGVDHVFSGLAALEQCLTRFAVSIASDLDLLEQTDAFARNDQVGDRLARNVRLFGRLADFLFPARQIGDVRIQQRSLRAQPVLLHGVVPLHCGAQAVVVGGGQLARGVRELLKPPHTDPRDHQSDKENQAEGKGQTYTDLGIGESHQSILPEHAPRAKHPQFSNSF